jgi:hypothetical protein
MSWWIESNSQGATTQFRVVQSTVTPNTSAAWPNAPIGPFTTRASAEATISQAQTSGGYTLQPTGSSSATTAGLQAAGIPNPLGGLAAIGDFFNRLTQANTWLRVGEVVVGLMLLYVGLNALSKDTAVGNALQSAAQNTKNVAKKIPLAVPE